VTRNNANSRLSVEVLAQDCIAVRDLCKIGALAGGWVEIRAGIRWPTIRRMMVARYRILIELHNQTLPQQIRISWTPCHLGGERPWIHCPHCEKRVARLFKGLAGYFCRDCVGNPPYESQLRNDRSRTCLRAYRLRQRIGGGRPVIDPIRERPYRMWRRTYNRIRAEVELLEQQLIGSRVLSREPQWIRPLSY
jgi:hypothetical protein